MALLSTTLASLIARIRLRSDQRRSKFVTDAEIAELVNTSRAALRDIVLDAGLGITLVEGFGGTVTAGTNALVLSTGGAPDSSDDAYRVLAVDVEFGGTYRAIRSFTLDERNPAGAGAPSNVWDDPDRLRYLVTYSQDEGILRILFNAAAPTDRNVAVQYAPIAHDVDSSTPVNMASLNGWDEYVVADVCAMIVEAEEGDARPHLARKMEAAKRVRWAAANLDAAGVEGLRETVDWGSDTPLALELLE